MLFTGFNRTLVDVGANDSPVFDEPDAFELTDNFGIFANGPSESPSFKSCSLLISFFKNDGGATDR